MTTDLPPCHGLHKIFESTDLADHAEAATICATCPMLDACDKLREDVQATSQPGYGPAGTWAGKLYGTPNRKPARSRAELAAEEALYTPEEVLAAHSAFNQGDPSDWAIVGHRVYERQRARRRAAAKRQAQETAA